MKMTSLLIVLMLTLCACTKFGKNVTVKGRVLNPVTGEGISGVEVQLQKTTGGIPGGYKTVKTATTDADGNFEISKASLRKLDIVCNTSLYEIGWHQNGEPLKGQYRTEVRKGKVMHLDYYAVPYGSIALQIENVNCEGSTDSMQFRSRSQFETTFEDSWSTYRVGCYNFTSSSASQIHIGTWYYEVKVKRPSGISYVYDTIVVTEANTAQLQLLY